MFDNWLLKKSREEPHMGNMFVFNNKHGLSSGAPQCHQSSGHVREISPQPEIREILQLWEDHTRIRAALTPQAERWWRICFLPQADRQTTSVVLKTHHWIPGSQATGLSTLHAEPWRDTEENSHVKKSDLEALTLSVPFYPAVNKFKFPHKWGFWLVYDVKINMR